MNPYSFEKSQTLYQKAFQVIPKGVYGHSVQRFHLTVRLTFLTPKVWRFEMWTAMSS